MTCTKPSAIEPGELLMLVDGNNLVHRAYHGRPPELDHEGRLCHAIRGFADSIASLRAQHRPELLLCVFDGAGPNWRHDVLPTYKATRPRAPADLHAQWEGVYAEADRLRVPWLREAGIEADDLIASYAEAGRRLGLEVLIVSSDKDLMQLVRGDRPGPGTVHQLVQRRRFTPAEVREKFGVGPEQLADYLALVGDTQDNVPGVPGIGPKTACALLEEFGSLARMLEPSRLKLVHPMKLRTKLRAHLEGIQRCREIVGLKLDLPTPLAIAEVRDHRSARFR